MLVLKYDLFYLTGVAGMCSKTAVAPLDRIKILLQAHSNHYKHLGVFSGLRHIVRRESLWALYKGNSAQMVRIFPYAATQFTAFEFYKRVCNIIFNNNFICSFMFWCELIEMHSIVYSMSEHWYQQINSSKTRTNSSLGLALALQP